MASENDSTHTASVELLGSQIEGRWPGGGPEINQVVEVETNGTHGFKGIVTEYASEYAIEGRKLRLELYGRPCERRELSNPIRAWSIRWKSLEREHRAYDENGNTVAVMPSYPTYAEIQSGPVGAEMRRHQEEAERAGISIRSMRDLAQSARLAGRTTEEVAAAMEREIRIRQSHGIDYERVRAEAIRQRTALEAQQRFFENQRLAEPWPENDRSTPEPPEPEPEQRPRMPVRRLTDRPQRKLLA